MKSRIVKRKIQTEYEMDVKSFIKTDCLIDENGGIWYKRISRCSEDRRSTEYNRIYVLFDITHTIESLSERNNSTLVWPTGLNYVTVVITNNKPIKGYKPYNKVQVQPTQVFVVEKL